MEYFWKTRPEKQDFYVENYTDYKNLNVFSDFACSSYHENNFLREFPLVKVLERAGPLCYAKQKLLIK